MHRLNILQGSNKGTSINLEMDKEYLIGREDSCDIIIDKTDKTVSRKHATIKIISGKVVIDNLSKTNPVMIKGKPVQQAVLKNNDRFQVGATMFSVQGDEPKKGSSKGTSNKKLIILAGLLICGIAFLFFALFQNSEDNSVKKEGNKPSIEDDLLTPQALPSTDLTVKFPKISGLKVSSQEMKKADEHYRQGMFFYDTGNLGKAMDEWSRAITIYPDHPDAKVWYLKAEKELEDAVKVHYQNAMMHYKYMRYDDAVHEFNSVVELARNKNSDIYMESLRYLDELRKK